MQGRNRVHAMNTSYLDVHTLMFRQLAPILVHSIGCACHSKVVLRVHRGVANPGNRLMNHQSEYRTVLLTSVEYVASLAIPNPVYQFWLNTSTDLDIVVHALVLPCEPALTRIALNVCFTEVSEK